MSTVRMLTAEEVAAILDCQPSTVEAAWRAGTLPGFRLGQHWRVPEPALYEGIHLLAMSNFAAARGAAAAEPARPTGRLMAVPGSMAANQRTRSRPLPELPDLPASLSKAG